MGIPEVGGSGIPGDPGELMKLARQIPGLEKLIIAFWAAVRAGDAARATAILEEITLLLARYPAIAARMAGLVSYMSAMLQRLASIAGVAGSTVKDLFMMSAELAEEFAALEAEAAAAAEALATLGSAGSGPPGWLIGLFALAFFFVVCTLMAKADELEGHQPAGGKKAPPKNPLDKLPPDWRNNPAYDPVAKLNAVTRDAYAKFQKWRRDKCRCQSGSQALAPLGPNFAGQQLAFASVPPSPGGMSGNGKGGGMGQQRPGAASATPRGPAQRSPDPFSFPSKGGTPLPPPGKGGKPGPTLPGAHPRVPPPIFCRWPDCPKGRQQAQA